MNFKYIFNYVLENLETFRTLADEATDVYKILEQLYQDFRPPVGSDGLTQMTLDFPIDCPELSELVDDIRLQEVMEESRFAFGRPKMRDATEVITLIVQLWPIIKQIIEAVRESRK